MGIQPSYLSAAVAPSWITKRKEQVQRFRILENRQTLSSLSTLLMR